MSTLKLFRGDGIALLKAAGFHTATEKWNREKIEKGIMDLLDVANEDATAVTNQLEDDELLQIWLHLVEADDVDITKEGPTEFLKDEPSAADDEEAWDVDETEEDDEDDFDDETKEDIVDEEMMEEPQDVETEEEPQQESTDDSGSDEDDEIASLEAQLKAIKEAKKAKAKKAREEKRAVAKAEKDAEKAKKKAERKANGRTKGRRKGAINFSENRFYWAGVVLKRHGGVVSELTDEILAEVDECVGKPSKMTRNQVRVALDVINGFISVD